MRIGIDMGHTLSGANFGAVGIIKESLETRELGNRVINILKSRGHDVVNCTVDTADSNTSSLNERVKRANSNNLDLFVSIHFNAGKGKGTEVFTYNGKKLLRAERLLNNMASLGFLNRGIKNGTVPRKLAVINNTRAETMLIEVCFVDTQSDVDLYRKNIDNIAKSIVNGITGEELDVIEKGETPNSLKLCSCETSPIASSMKEEIKILQGIVSFTRDGVATEGLANALPILLGGETRGCVTVMQRILIMKGFLSRGSDTGIIGPACKGAINRFKLSVGLNTNGELVDKNTWRKLLEY